MNKKKTGYFLMCIAEALEQLLVYVFLARTIPREEWIWVTVRHVA